jgi:uncharacterized membrane protein YdbT with pleckstrin-like domain
MLVLPAVVFLASVGLAAYLAALAEVLSWHAFAWLALSVLAVAVIGRFSLAPLLRWLCTHFVATDRRVLVREGVLSRSGFEIPMNRITGVHFRQTVLERMLGCGTLSLESYGDEPLEFADIPHVQQVYGSLYRAAEGA